MENKQLQKQKDIKNRLFIAIGLATLAIILTIFKLPFDFLLALIAYILTAIAIVKKEGMLGILQVILVFPAIYTSIRDFFAGNDAVDDNTNTQKTGNLERLANFALFFTAVTILVTIFFPIFRFIWNLFT